MPSMHLPNRHEPFVFSKVHRYWILTFFALAFLGLFIDQSQGKDFPSDSSITLILGYPLAMVYFFWSAYDTFSWLRMRPDEFFRFAKVESKKKMSSFLSNKTYATWFFFFYIAFTFVLGIFMFVATAQVITTWFRS